MGKADCSCTVLTPWRTLPQRQASTWTGERQQLRRYSRSFSEPNLALFLQAVRADFIRPMSSFFAHDFMCYGCTPAFLLSRAMLPSKTIFMALQSLLAGAKQKAAAQKLQEEGEDVTLADSSEEDADADNVMSRLQGTVEAVQVCKI